MKIETDQQDKHEKSENDHILKQKLANQTTESMEI